MRYDELVKEVGIYKPKTIMEIGSFRCARAERMIGEAIKFADNSNDIFYYGFDLFEGLTPDLKLSEFCGKAKSPDESLCEHKLISLGCQYQLIKGNTRETLKTFVPARKIDFVFIDGGHSIPTITSDWNNVVRVCEKGCIVYFDDYYPNNMEVGAFFLEPRLVLEGYQVSFLHATDEECLEGNEVRIMKVVI